MCSIFRVPHRRRLTVQIIISNNAKILNNMNMGVSFFSDLNIVFQSHLRAKNYVFMIFYQKCQIFK